MEEKKMEAEQTLQQEKRGKKMMKKRCLEKATSEGREVMGKIVAEESHERERERMM